MQITNDRTDASSLQEFLYDQWGVFYWPCIQDNIFVAVEKKKNDVDIFRVGSSFFTSKRRE
jgi:hypothetical protein